MRRVNHTQFLLYYTKTMAKVRLSRVPMLLKVRKTCPSLSKVGQTGACGLDCVLFLQLPPFSHRPEAALQPANCTIGHCGLNFAKDEALIARMPSKTHRKASLFGKS
jgi:hypothetical protein